MLHAAIRHGALLVCTFMFMLIYYLVPLHLLEACMLLMFVHVTLCSMYVFGTYIRTIVHLQVVRVIRVVQLVNSVQLHSCMLSCRDRFRPCSWARQSAQKNKRMGKA